MKTSRREMFVAAVLLLGTFCVAATAYAGKVYVTWVWACQEGTCTYTSPGGLEIWEEEEADDQWAVVADYQSPTDCPKCGFHLQPKIVGVRRGQ